MLALLQTSHSFYLVFAVICQYIYTTKLVVGF